MSELEDRWEALKALTDLLKALQLTIRVKNDRINEMQKLLDSLQRGEKPVK